ncbi:MAG: hypothetical protein EU530_08450 [Promethearchaeota archaeon]|nr:MAG: hypothetical protein EU530_08450 [Candidatus Lokiarchaeota archaeon]
MSFRLDILAEDGVARLCSLNNKAMEIKVKTPIAVLPIIDYLLDNDHYAYLLKQQNIVYMTSSPDQTIPISQENHLIFQYSKTNYYTSDLRPEPLLPAQVSENTTHFFSKTCPSSMLHDEFAVEWYTQFFQEIIKEIEEEPQKIEKMNGFGVVMNFHDLRNPDILLNLIESFVSNPLIYNNIVALKIDGLFDKKMDYTSSVDTFLRLKKLFPADLLYIASGLILPYEYAFLINLGFDAIDLSYLLHTGYFGLYYRHEEGMEWVRKLHSIEEFACNCEECDVVRELLTEFSVISDIPSFYTNFALHNLRCGLMEIERVRKNIQRGSLSTYLERKSQLSLLLLSALRHIQKNYPSIFNSTQSLNKETSLPCTTPLSYHNPNVEQYRQKLRHNVEPRPNTKICIFLPCSMGKPYSKSKSHRNFIKIIKNAAKKWYKYISEVIITSPLGIVPREIEEVFPAAHYDISVTGDWDAEELQLTSREIVDWIKKLPHNVKIIAYLHGGYQKAFELAMQIIESEEKSTITYSIPSNIDEFSDAIIHSLEELTKQETSGRIGDSLSNEEQSIKMIADFQFGTGAGTALIGSAARFLQSRNDNIKTINGFESHGKLQLGRYLRSSGHITLNYQGGERLSEQPGIAVTLNTADISGTTIFKPGIEHVDEGLCAGDECVILGPNSEYLGVGSLVVRSETYSRMRRGAVVKIRKLKKEGE